MLLSLIQHPWKSFLSSCQGNSHSVLSTIGNGALRRHSFKKHSLCNVACVWRLLCKYAQNLDVILFIIEMNSLQKTNSIFGGTPLESYERECRVGPVGGREMPWIRNQNTRCYRGSDAIKSNEGVSKREAMRAVCLAGWLPAWKETQRVFRRTQNSWIFCICLHCIEILPKEFAFHMDFVFNYPQSETPAGLERGRHEAGKPTWIQSLHLFVPQIPNL